MLDGLLFAMVDPSTCVETAAGWWATLSWALFRWLSKPGNVVLLLAAWIGLPWVFRLPYKRWVSGIGIGLLGLYFWSATPAAIALGQRALTHFVPPDQGQPADAIVILGRGAEMRRDRADIAAELWREGRAPLIFVSGINDAPAIASYLQAQGLPAAAVDGEPCSRTTAENAQFTAGVLNPQSVKQIILITDPPHMLRSRLTFQSLGYDVIPHYSPLSPKLGQRTASLLVFREYAGLAAYGVLGRFSPRQVLPPADGDAAYRSPVSPGEREMSEWAIAALTQFVE